MTDQIKQRTQQENKFNRFWLIPIISLTIFIFLFVTYYILDRHNSNKAFENYNNAEQHIEAKQFTKAKESLELALAKQNNFPQAETTLNFTEKALTIEKNINSIEGLIKDELFDEALEIVSDDERSLQNYQGQVVNDLIETLSQKQDEISIKKIKHELEQEDISIDDLKMILWEADDISNDDAEKITEDIREEIIEYSVSHANEQLNNNQFSDARIFIEDGLKYAPNSDRLLSLEKTIEKEKESFETAQLERIEQAIHMAEQEQTYNETDAVKVKEIDLSYDDQDRLLIFGEIKSDATVPIQSVFIEYNVMTKKDSHLLTNRVFVYPDQIYPGDRGTFEFTHYDMTDVRDDLVVEVEKVSWYTE